MTNFVIKVVSDSVCPWCYIGKRKLEGGIKSYKTAHPGNQDTFSIEWLPFYLNPEASETGTPRNERLDKVYGPERLKAMLARIKDIGKDYDIDFKFEGLTGKTRNSHRIIRLAGTKSQDVQDRVVDALFHAYFEEEGNIVDKKVLKNAALKGGLDAAEVDDLLASDKFNKEVDAEAAEARRNLITGVPHFTLNDKYEIGGAQDSEGFRRIFEKIKEMEG